MEPEHPILHAIVRGVRAWSTPAELARATGLEVDTTLDQVADLDQAGWVACWDRPDGPVVTLTPLAAERLGVRILEVGRDLMPRWDRPEVWTVDRPVRASVDRGRPETHWPDRIDPGPGPAEQAIAAEELLATTGPRRGDIDTSPRLSVLIAASLTPWPGPTAAASCCPGCGGRPLRAWEYCLYCDRWGLDRPVKARRRRSEAQTAESGRASRKARLKARFGRRREVA